MAELEQLQPRLHQAIFVQSAFIDDIAGIGDTLFPTLRGKELSAEELRQFSATLEGYAVVAIELSN